MLPPDLDRLGEALTLAAERTADARRRAMRLRLAAGGLIAALALAVIMAGVLRSARHATVHPEFASASVPSKICVQPRAARLTDPRPCALLYVAPEAR